MIDATLKLQSYGTVEIWLLLPLNYSTYLNVKCCQKLARCDITTVFVVFVHFIFNFLLVFHLCHILRMSKCN